MPKFEDLNEATQDFCRSQKQDIKRLDDEIGDLELEISALQRKIYEREDKRNLAYQRIADNLGCDCWALGIPCRGHNRANKEF